MVLCIRFHNSGSVTEKNMPGHRNEKKYFFRVTIFEEVMYCVIMDPSLQREAQISEPFYVCVKRFSSLRRRDEPIHFLNGTALLYG